MLDGCCETPPKPLRTLSDLLANTLGTLPGVEMLALLTVDDLW
jgi:hypothetical protein